MSSPCNSVDDRDIDRILSMDIPFDLPSDISLIAHCDEVESLETQDPSSVMGFEDPLPAPLVEDSQATTQASNLSYPVSGMQPLVNTTGGFSVSSNNEISGECHFNNDTDDSEMKEESSIPEPNEESDRLNEYFLIFINLFLGGPFTDNPVNNGRYHTRLLQEGQGVDKGMNQLLTMLRECKILITAASEALTMLQSRIVIPAVMVEQNSVLVPASPGLPNLPTIHEQQQANSI